MDLNKELERLRNLEDVELDFNAQLDSGERASNVFCAGWPTTKTVLEAIKEMIKNPFAKIVIGAVIAIGDGFYKKRCN